MMDLNTLWFAILGGLLAGYVVLDGYDLGIGVIHLFTADSKRRDHLLALIGPYWDGNEVWLIVAGGVLFAVFPGAYAALLSGFYPHFIVLLLAFIVRGLAIDLHSKYGSAAWRRFWDVCFGGASLVAAGLVGVVGANLASGVPTDSAGIVRVDAGSSLGPRALVAAALAGALLTMHGALYASTKGAQDRQCYLTKWAFAAWGLALALVIPAAALNINPAGPTAAKSHPVLFSIVAALLVATLFYVPWALRRCLRVRAFLASAFLVIELLVVAAMLLYPRLIRSTLDDSHSLTIYNAAATHPTMTVMLVILAITAPPAIAYMIFVRLVLARSSGPHRGNESAGEVAVSRESTV